MIDENKKKQIGVIVGPILFVLVVSIPTPNGMLQIAESNSLPSYAPQVALGTMLWMLAWWLSE